MHLDALFRSPPAALEHDPRRDLHDIQRGGASSTTSYTQYSHLMRLADHPVFNDFEQVWRGMRFGGSPPSRQRIAELGVPLRFRNFARLYKSNPRSPRLFENITRCLRWRSDGAAPAAWPENGGPAPRSRRWVVSPHLFAALDSETVRPHAGAFSDPSGQGLGFKANLYGVKGLSGEPSHVLMVIRFVSLNDAMAHAVADMAAAEVAAA